MSDKDKKPEKPLENPKVYVNVVPKDDKKTEHHDAAEKAGKTLKENVEKAIEKNKPGGKEKQFDAADSEVKKAEQGTNPKQIDKIRVRVVDKDKDGNGVAREWTVTPKEDKGDKPAS